MPESKLKIRPASPEDLPAVYTFVKELATFENEPHEPTITLEEFVRDGSGPEPRYEALVAELQGKHVGMALYYMGYSTWKGSMLYLDDLVVSESYRRKGIGHALLLEVIDVGRRKKVNQIRWQVLDWNEPAIEMYKKFKAVFDPAWVNCRLDKAAIYHKIEH